MLLFISVQPQLHDQAHDSRATTSNVCCYFPIPVITCQPLSYAENCPTTHAARHQKQAGLIDEVNHCPGYEAGAAVNSIDSSN